jgi:hypothetical protein
MKSIFGPKLNICSNPNDLAMAAENSRIAFGITKERQVLAKKEALEAKLKAVENEYRAFIAQQYGCAYLPPKMDAEDATYEIIDEPSPSLVPPKTSVQFIDSVPIPGKTGPGPTTTATPVKSQDPEPDHVVPTILRGPIELGIEARVKSIQELRLDMYNFAKDTLVEISTRVYMPQIFRHLERIKSATDIVLASDIPAINNKTAKRGEMKRYDAAIQKMLEDDKCGFSPDDPARIMGACQKFMVLSHIYNMGLDPEIAGSDNLDSIEPFNVAPCSLADAFNLAMTAIGNPVQRFVHDSLDLETTRRQEEFLKFLKAQQQQAAEQEENPAP